MTLHDDTLSRDRTVSKVLLLSRASRRAMQPIFAVAKDGVSLSASGEESATVDDPLFSVIKSSVDVSSHSACTLSPRAETGTGDTALARSAAAAATTAAASAPSGDWRQSVDPKSKRPFWWNVRTRERSWNAPPSPGRGRDGAAYLAASAAARHAATGDAATGDADAATSAAARDVALAPDAYEARIAALHEEISANADRQNAAAAKVAASTIALAAVTAELEQQARDFEAAGAAAAREGAEREVQLRRDAVEARGALDALVRDYASVVDGARRLHALRADDAAEKAALLQRVAALDRAHGRSAEAFGGGFALEARAAARAEISRLSREVRVYEKEAAQMASAERAARRDSAAAVAAERARAQELAQLASAHVDTEAQLAAARREREALFAANGEFVFYIVTFHANHTHNLTRSPSYIFRGHKRPRFVTVKCSAGGPARRKARRRGGGRNSSTRASARHARRCALAPPRPQRRRRRHDAGRRGGRRRRRGGSSPGASLPSRRGGAGCAARRRRALATPSPSTRSASRRPRSAATSWRGARSRSRASLAARRRPPRAAAAPRRPPPPQRSPRARTSLS